MKFAYTYRSSDGARHTAEIEAENLDAAFAKVRTELGIKPIKVVGLPGDDSNKLKSKGLPKRWIFAALVGFSILGLLAVLVWRGGVRPSPEQLEQFTVSTPQGPVTYTVATPLARQFIPGDRQRVGGNLDKVFTSSAERLLARFAEPGRPVAALEGEAPTEAEFAACLRNPIHIASTDFTEVVDLKRIVSGMKREMRSYLAAGGVVEEYIAELSKRQKLEVSYRENAVKRLAELLPNPKDAYAYWLKANASLKSMGIQELPLPESLRNYQAGIDLDD